MRFMLSFVTGIGTSSVCGSGEGLCCCNDADLDDKIALTFWCPLQVLHFAPLCASGGLDRVQLRT